jgi:hypothetical protein
LSGKGFLLDIPRGDARTYRTGSSVSSGAAKAAPDRAKRRKEGRKALICMAMAMDNRVSFHERN